MTQPNKPVSQRAREFRDCRQQWQKDQGKKCSCKGTDDMCPCQNFEKHYRGWSIDYVNPPIPIRDFDWSATHPDYDGADDGRHVFARTRELAQAEVDAWIEENGDA